MSGSENLGRNRERPNLRQLFDSLQPSEPLREKTRQNFLGDRFVLIPPGTFLMGSTHLEGVSRLNELPQHEIQITQPFYLAVTPLSDVSYAALLPQKRSRAVQPTQNSKLFPAVNVSWHQALEWISLLNQRPEEQESKRRYRLPTEAEWEYACRAGSEELYGLRSRLNPDDAAFDWRFPSDPALKREAPTGAQPLGEFPANSFGLQDMVGQVWEWCQDWYDEKYYAESPLRDPPGPGEGQYRVLRGGSWKSQASSCRAAYRNALPPHVKQSSVGFRLVLEVTES